ncbi:hypothetical protein P879_11583 [Paragonimus westermani]|uniref:Uncharacterized protein n=3 Tax=Paragonimus TaxID=34503 RepID=A0A8T0D9F0_9TREM|nr:large subunit ribosomal protein L34e [Paragonimus westermani]KAF7251435.1 hypothetical protein EG68_08056 [Paragonimus skrjabini miyazakii]KAF8563321.1 hypothetical protein P879_11583 [Paragonimus westermani]
MQRLTLRRRLSYNTESNKRKKVKTPGGRVVYIYLKKRGKVPKCGDCKAKLPGIKPSRPRQRSSMSKRLKTVNRAYGGTRCHKCVRNRVIRAFMMEEQKVLNQLVKEQRRKERRAAAHVTKK